MWWQLAVPVVRDHDPGRRAGLGGDLQGVRQVSWGGAQRLAVETQPSALSEPGKVREREIC